MSSAVSGGRRTSGALTSGMATSASFVSRAGSRASRGSTFKPDKVDLFGKLAPKERDDSNKTLGELLKEEALSAGMARMLMKEYEDRGEFPTEASKRRARQARMASREPVSAQRRQAELKAEADRASGEACQWQGRHPSTGVKLVCGNRRLRHPRHKELTLYCGFHQRVCVAVHPGGMADIQVPNPHGLCDTHFTSRMQRKPPRVAGAWAVPGVVEVRRQGRTHPMAPGPGRGDSATLGRGDGGSDSDSGPELEPDALDHLLLSIRRAQFRSTGIPTAAGRRAIIKVQAHFRRHLATRAVGRIRRRKQAEARQRAARSIQLAFRARRSARDLPFRQQISHTAAVTIQRGFRLSRLVRALELDRRRRLAAITVQRWFRGVRMRAAFLQMRLRLRARVDGIRAARARVMISALMSRFVARFRRRLADMRLAKRILSASRIQRCFRAHLGWKRRFEVRAAIAAELFSAEAVNRIQVAWLALRRRRAGRDARKVRLRLIVRMQAAARGMLGRRRARHRRRELESVWRWMDPAMPRSHYPSAAPRYEEMFDLSAFRAAEPEQAPASGTDGGHERPRRASDASTVVGGTDPCAEAAAGAEHAFPTAPQAQGSPPGALAGASSASVASVPGGAGPDLAAQSALQIARARAAQQEAREAAEKLQAASVMDSFEARLAATDPAGTGVVTPQAFLRCLLESGMSRREAVALRGRFHDVEFDGVRWRKALRFARTLGPALFDIKLWAGAIAEFKSVYQNPHEAPAVKSSLRGLPAQHLPSSTLQDAKTARFSAAVSGNAAAVASARHGGRRAGTHAGTHAFSAHPEMLPAVPQPVPGVKGTTVQETIAVVDLPGGRGPAVAMMTDADIYDPESTKRGPLAAKAQQAVLSSFLGLAEADTTAMNRAARRSLLRGDDPRGGGAAARASAMVKRAAATTREAAAPDDEYAASLADAIDGVRPTPADGRFSNAERFPVSPDGQRDSAPAAAAAAQGLQRLQRSLAPDGRAPRPALGRGPKRSRATGPGRAPGGPAIGSLGDTLPEALPVVMASERRGLGVGDSAGRAYASLLLALAAPPASGPDPLQENPPTALMGLLSARYALFMRRWRELVRDIRVGAAIGAEAHLSPQELDRVERRLCPQPDRAALLEAVVRRLGMASSVVAGARRGVAGVTRPAPQDRAWVPSASQHPFALPGLAEAVPSDAPLRTEQRGGTISEAGGGGESAADLEAAYASRFEAGARALPSPGTPSSVIASAALGRGLGAEARELNRIADGLEPPVVLGGTRRDPGPGQAVPRPLSTRAMAAVAAASKRFGAAAAASSEAGADPPSLVWTGPSRKTPPYVPPAQITLPGCSAHQWLAPSGKCTQCRAYRRLPAPQPPCTFHASALLALSAGGDDVGIRASAFEAASKADQELVAAAARRAGFDSVLVVHVGDSAGSLAWFRVLALCEDSTGSVWAIGERVWAGHELRALDSRDVRKCPLLSRHQVMLGRMPLFVRITATSVAGVGYIMRAKAETQMRSAARARGLDPGRCVFFASRTSTTEERRMLAASALRAALDTADEARARAER